MSIEFRFLCAALAVWRLSHLLAEEDGPADVIVRVRAALGDSVAGRAMDCFYCLSLWIAAPLAGFVTVRPAEFLVVWLALSGAACAVERSTSRAGSASSDPSLIHRAAHGGDSHGLLRTATAGISDPDPIGATTTTTSTGQAEFPHRHSHAPW